MKNNAIPNAENVRRGVKQRGINADSLLPFKRYYISKVIVTYCGGPFEVCDYDSWTLTKSILVEEVEEAVVRALPCSFTSTKSSNMFDFADIEIALNLGPLSYMPFHVDRFHTTH